MKIPGQFSTEIYTVPTDRAADAAFGKALAEEGPEAFLDHQ